MPSEKTPSYVGGYTCINVDTGGGGGGVCIHCCNMFLTAQSTIASGRNHIMWVGLISDCLPCLARTSNMHALAHTLLFSSSSSQYDFSVMCDVKEKLGDNRSFEVFSVFANCVFRFESGSARYNFFC